MGMKMGDILEKCGIARSIMEIYPLVNVYITMENPHAINGKIHYFYSHFQ